MTRRELLKYGLYSGLAAGVSLNLCLSGCGKRGGSEKDGRPNIVLISLDTVRRDHCSVYGYERDTTPNLAVFAEQGTSFDLAYAPTSTTGPTHATVFTSLHPIAHGILKNGHVLSGEYETLAEIFRTAGYQTASIASSFVLHSKFGYAQGFAHYDDDFPSSESTVKLQGWEGHHIEEAFDRRAYYATNRAIRWLKEQRDPDRPFFLFAHYFDPHNPYTPPDVFARRFAPKEAVEDSLEKNIGLYDGEIAFTDQEVGNLLSALEWMELEDETLVVIFSDHGEGLMDHGYMYHGVHIYEEMVRVPLLFRWPEHVPQGRVIGAPVGLVDLAPTILDLAGVESKGESFQGKSLASSICGEASLDPERPIYLYRRHYEESDELGIWVKGEKFGIRKGNWKYIEGREENTNELFNLKTDPGEKTNLYGTAPEKAAELASHLQQWISAQMRSRSVQGRISEQDLSRLRKIGYVR
jgi:arylsulfatase A-like enzyme